MTIEFGGINLPARQPICNACRVPAQVASLQSLILEHAIGCPAPGREEFSGGRHRVLTAFTDLSVDPIERGAKGTGLSRGRSAPG